MTGSQNQLSSLAKKNRLLASELKRLPDLAEIDGRDEPRDGLSALVETYLHRTDAFESLFGEICRVGRRRDRKYCAPLQAIYWLNMENRLEGFFGQTADGAPAMSDTAKPAAAPPILDRLLDWAWFDEPLFFFRNRYRPHHRWPPVGARHNRIQPPLRHRRGSKLLQKYILEDFQDKPEVFNPGDRPLIGRALRQSRWQNFDAVCDRLNAPELIHYYFKHRLTYTQTPARGTYRTFRSGRGQCTDAAYFSRDMLARSGYRTFIRSVKWNADPWTGLHTGAGAIGKNGHYLLVANFNGVNKLSGPFGRIDQVDRCLARGNAIIDRRWGAYFPPLPEHDR